MNSEMIEFFLSSGVPSCFVDDKGKIDTNVKMTDLIYSMIYSQEMADLLERIDIERSPFVMTSNFTSNFNQSPKVWQFHFLPLFCSENGYLGTFFHAHEFLFLSPLDYVDGKQPYTVTMQQPDDILSHREWQIVFLMMHRFSSKEISRRLNIFPSTVESHLKAIYGKVNVHSACELRAFGNTKGFDRYIPLDFFEKSKCISTGYYSNVREVYGI